MNETLSLCLKITNWCNLNCAHCCERSGLHEAPNFIPIDKIEKYICEFKQIPMRTSNLMVIGGGEALSPYMHNNFNYIPRALDLIYDQGYIPTLKTNATWGNSDNLRKRILKDLAACAYRAEKLVTLDISVDEFHNNITPVAKVIYDTICSPELCFAIRIFLVGFNTKKSEIAKNTLKRELQTKGLLVKEMLSGDWAVAAPNSEYSVMIMNDFMTHIYNQGRAKDNKVYTTQSNPVGDNCENCLQIDNNDTAILNYMYREQIKNRSLSDVVIGLMRQKEY